MSNLRPSDPKGKPAALPASTARFLERYAKQSPDGAAELRARLGFGEPSAAYEPPPAAPPAPPAARAPAAPHAPQRHRQGPKPSRRERTQTRRAALQRRESAYLQALTDRVRAAGGHGVGIRAIPLRVWTMCLQITADATGRAARVHLRQLKNRTAAGAILSAALQPPELPGHIPHAPEWAQPEPEPADAPRRSWASLRTRRIAALGLALTHLAGPTRRRGPWGGLVMGIPRGAFCKLLRDPYDPDHDRGTPAITTVFGTHRRGAAADSAQVGYFVALRSAGLAYRQQLPAHEASPYEVQGPSGHATNRYWIASDVIACMESDEARELALALAQLASVDADALASQLRRERAPSQAPP